MFSLEEDQVISAAVIEWNVREAAGVATICPTVGTVYDSLFRNASGEVRQLISAMFTGWSQERPTIRTICQPLNR